jgi:DNA-binding transcriptional LysR family regulator
MEIRDLRYFVAVAEDLSFKRAAERLGVSQSQLSQTLSRFEEDLDIPLFTRGQRRSPLLTHAGKVLLTEARLILTQIQVAQAMVRDDPSHVVPIKIASLSSVFAGLLPRVIPQLRQADPDMHITLHNLEGTPLINAIREGRIDVGFARTVEKSPDYALHVLALEPLYCVLPSTHPLAAQEVVDLADLATEDFALFERLDSSHHFDAIITACQRVGFSPRIGSYTPDDISTLSTVSCGLGVSLMPYQSSFHAFEGVTYRPLKQDWASTPLSLISHPELLTTAVERFIAMTQAEVRRTAAADALLGRRTFILPPD